MPVLFILFVLLPLTEIVILIQVGQLIGVWYTIGLVLLSAFIGVNLLRQQGLSTLLRARSRMDQGELPAMEMLEGIILAVGGALLVTPGLVTDTIGFCCLIPQLRRRIVVALQKHWTLVVSERVHTAEQASPQRGFEGEVFGEGSFDVRHNGGRTTVRGDVIDGEYRREE